MNLILALLLVESKAEHVTFRSDTLAGGNIPALVTLAFKTRRTSKMPIDVAFPLGRADGQHSSTAAAGKGRRRGQAEENGGWRFNDKAKSNVLFQFVRR